MPENIFDDKNAVNQGIKNQGYQFLDDKIGSGAFWKIYATKFESVDLLCSALFFSYVTIFLTYRYKTTFHKFAFVSLLIFSHPIVLYLQSYLRQAFAALLAFLLIAFFRNFLISTFAAIIHPSAVVIPLYHLLLEKKYFESIKKILITSFLVSLFYILIYQKTQFNAGHYSEWSQVEWELCLLFIVTFLLSWSKKIKSIQFLSLCSFFLILNGLPFERFLPFYILLPKSDWLKLGTKNFILLFVLPFCIIRWLIVFKNAY